MRAGGWLLLAATGGEDAMRTSGVYAVDSQLRWPSSQAGPQPSGAPMQRDGRAPRVSSPA